MILVRVEPIDNIAFPLSEEEKKKHFLSAIPERIRDRMAGRFNENDLGNVIGCWFSDANSRSEEGQLDVLTYANEIIKDDHPDSGVRVIAIEIPDGQVEMYHVKNSKNSYVQNRSKNQDPEYVVPTSLISKSASVVLELSPDETLTEKMYISALEKFQNDGEGANVNLASALPQQPHSTQSRHLL